MATAAPPVAERRRWEIDARLSALVGRPVRVGARAFAPQGWTRTENRDLITAAQLILTDGSTAVLPLLFEGRLLDYVRRIAVVHVRLDGLDSNECGGDGVVAFRGATATILRGPALVELAFPFFAEALPLDASNYFADRQAARCQLLLPLGQAPLGPQKLPSGISWPGNPA